VIEKEISPRQVEIGSDVFADRFCSVSNRLVPKEAASALHPLPFGSLTDDPLRVLGLHSLGEPVPFTRRVAVVFPTTEGLLLRRSVGVLGAFQQQRGSHQERLLDLRVLRHLIVLEDVGADALVSLHDRLPETVGSVHDVMSAVCVTLHHDGVLEVGLLGTLAERPTPEGFIGVQFVVPHQVVLEILDGDVDWLEILPSVCSELSDVIGGSTSTEGLTGVPILGLFFLSQHRDRVPGTVFVTHLDMLPRDLLGRVDVPCVALLPERVSAVADANDGMWSFLWGERVDTTGVV
jgi:hypothetical protein